MKKNKWLFLKFSILSLFLFLINFSFTKAIDTQECLNKGGTCIETQFCKDTGSIQAVSLGDLGCANSNNSNFVCCGKPCSSIEAVDGGKSQCSTASECQTPASKPQECSDVCCKELKTSEDSCTDKTDGTSCLKENVSGFCYNSKCETTPGSERSLCGAGTATDGYKSSCRLKSEECKNIDSSGLGCAEGLNCCKRIFVDIDVKCGTDKKGLCVEDRNVCSSAGGVVDSGGTGDCTDEKKPVCCHQKEESPCDTCANPCPDDYEEVVGEENQCGMEGDLCCAKKTSEDDECPSPEEGTGGGFLMFHGSIVPCGRSCDDSNTVWDETQSCTLCHFFIMFKQVYDLFFSLLIITALALLTIGGLIYILSGGSTGAKTLAKNMITKVIIGFGLFLLSWLLVFTVLKFISANTEMLGNGEKWYEFDCDTKSPFDEKEEKSSNSSNTENEGIDDSIDDNTDKETYLE